MSDAAIKRASDLRLDLFVHPELEIQIPKKSQQRVVGQFMQWVVRPVPGDRRTQLVRSLRQWIRGRFQHLRHLVISDDPGQGKTVLSLQIQKLLCTPKSRSRIFGDSYPRLVVHWMSRLPQTSMSHPSILDFFMADASLVHGFPDESVRKKVIDYATAEGRLVIVLDAFDELPAEQKRQVVKLFEESSDKIRWIVTGRDWAINREIADQKLFDPKEFFRLRIKAFSTKLQDLYMSRALPGVEWRSVLSGSKKDWDELLGLPATLRELIRALSLTSGKKGKALRFESPSDLFCFSSQQMLLRELRKDKNAEAIAEDGLDLKPTVAARLVQRGIGAVALEMALRGHWREVIKPTTPELDAEIQDIWTWAKKRFIEGGEDVSEESWKWVKKFLNQYEFNGGASQADLGSESLVFRNVRIQELNLGRYLVNFASPTDLRGAIKSRPKQVSKSAKRAQSVIECIGLKSWTNTWRSAIKMPVLERGKDHGVKRECYERGLRLLFERPAQVDQRRPTDLMWGAQEWLGKNAKLKALVPRLHDHLADQFQAIKQIPAYKSAVADLLDPARYVLLRCGDDPTLDKDTGVFLMGPDSGDNGRTVKVTLSERFGMSRYQVTREQFSIWDNLASKTERNLPAVGVSWLDCYFFLVGLSGERVKPSDGREYRFTFPTEAQWEYSCRAGSATSYCYGDDEEELTQYAWYDANRTGVPHAVGEKKPNAWGLYDMHGNVWEWCWDRYGKYPSEPVTDPVGPKEGSYRVIRGGSWINNAANCQSARRSRRYPSYRNFYLGFRLALSSSGIPQSPEADK